MMCMVLSFIMISSANDVNVFDESDIPCSTREKEKKCALVLIGSKQGRWVGHAVLEQRGQKGDVNDFLKNPDAFKGKIKKQTLKKVFGKEDRMSTLAGHLELDKKTQEWIAHLEGQFKKTLSMPEQRKFPLKGIYEK